MKHMTAIAFLLASTMQIMAEPYLGDFVTVTNLWYEGHKSNVLAIAEQRLAANSNDFAGLVLKMEYDFEFIEASRISNDMLSVIGIAQGITNSNIKAHSGEIKMELEDFLNFLKNDYHPTASELQEDKDKAIIIHKRMNFEDYLKWFHDDGLF